MVTQLHLAAMGQVGWSDQSHRAAKVLCDDEQFFHMNEWDTHLVKLTIDLYKGIGDHRNTHLHGTTKLEAKEKLRLRILQ
jgi:hypothetical protein